MDITTTTAKFAGQGIPLTSPNIINPNDILNHTHNITFNNINGLETFPDFSRIQLMYKGSDYCGSSIYKQFHRFPIFKINKPGYLYYQQHRYSLDTDVVCMLSDNPYNFLVNGEWTPYNYRDKKYNLQLNDNSANKTIYWGDALPGGDTYQTKFFPIYPGNNTYCLFLPIRGSHDGLEYYNFYFVPPVGLDSTQSCFTKVGETMYWNSQGYYIRGNLGSLGPRIFNRSGTSNTIKIKAFNCSGTQHDWNHHYHGTHQDNYGYRYYLINPNSNSDLHVYQMQHYHHLQISYNNEKWCMYDEGSIWYETESCESTTDPWNVTWKPAKGYQSWTKLPILRKAPWL